LLLDQPNHAHAALHAALEIKRTIVELDSNRPNPHPIKVGIGVATGRVIAGRIGSATSAEYATIGDIIIVAERLAANSQRGLFTNEETGVAVQDEFEMIEVKPIKVRRRLEPVKVFRIFVPTESAEEPLDEEPNPLVEEN
jgi:adenylate cyclase